MSLVQYENYQKIFNQSRENWKWFVKNRERLIQNFFGEFILISDNKVVAHNSELEKLLEEVELKYRTKDHLIEYITKEGIELILYENRRLF